MNKSDKVFIMLSNILEARGLITKTRSILFEMGYRETDDIMRIQDFVWEKLVEYSRMIEKI